MLLTQYLLLYSTAELTFCIYIYIYIFIIVVQYSRSKKVSSAVSHIKYDVINDIHS